MAKKKKSKIPKSLKKKYQEHIRAKNAINESQEKLLCRIKEHAEDSGIEHRIASHTPEKMSEIIIAYAKPLLEVTSTAAEQKKALIFAILIWNLSLLPENMQSEHKKEILKNMNISDTDDFPNEGHEVVDFLIQRKRLDFPDINRMVVDYDMIDTPKGVHLNVVSNINR